MLLVSPRSFPFPREITSPQKKLLLHRFNPSAAGLLQKGWGIQKYISELKNKSLSENDQKNSRKTSKGRVLKETHNLNPRLISGLKRTLGPTHPWKPVNPHVKQLSIQQNCGGLHAGFCGAWSLAVCVGAPQLIFSIQT